MLGEVYGHYQERVALEGHRCEKRDKEGVFWRYIKEGSILDVHLFIGRPESGSVSL